MQGDADCSCRGTGKLLLPVFGVLLLLPLLTVAPAREQAGPVTDDFELGDSAQPDVPGTGDILSISSVAGPDWEELFNRDGTLKDEVGPDGQPPANGIPDFIDLHGGRAALFVGDDISAGASTDGTIRFGDNVETGSVVSLDDLSNAYVYTTTDAAGNLLLYVGIERMDVGAGSFDIELNQGLFRLGHGWPGTSGWEVVGQRQGKDLRLQLEIGADGLIGSVTVQSWEDPESDGTFAWTVRDTLTAEGCNEADAGATPPIDADTLCAFRNQASIKGGEWPSYDASGETLKRLGPDCFFELGVNVGALLDVTDPDYDFKTVRLKTPGDIVFGHFGEGN